MSASIESTRMASVMPSIPNRPSSVEANRPVPSKKRMSLTAIPILSKLGLGKTSSAPTVPITSASVAPKAAARPSTPPAARTIEQVDAAELGDDTKTEVDEEENLMIEEPGSYDWGPSDRSTPIAQEATTKNKLSLDIPFSGASTTGPPSSFRPVRDPYQSDQKEVLREFASNTTNESIAQTPNSASIKTKGVWLCSKPQSSTPSSPIDENGKRRRSVGRPLVVRAMSTGRLASEFDEDGRVICLSNHCERVLRGRPNYSALPSPLEEGEELKRTVSAADALTPPRMGIKRSQTANNVGTPVANRRRSVGTGMRRLESFGSWSKRAIGAGDMSM